MREVIKGMNLTVSVTRNSEPTVVPTNWKAFEAARDARHVAAEKENSRGFQSFKQQTAERLQQGRENSASMT